MAIIYTYANFSPLTGAEKVLISDSDTNQATRTATAQQIANLAGGSTGVNRVFFNDNVGLTPSYTQTIGNETVGRGVVEFSGVLLPGAGGTGKDSAALTAATTGQVLVLNATKDGWDFGNAVGDTYSLAAQQYGAVPPYKGGIDLSDSVGIVSTVKIVGGTSISVTADAVTGEITVTNDAPGVTYTAGNGIDTSLLASGTIAADLKASGGLAFDNGEIETDLSSTNVGGAVGTSTQCLAPDGGGGMNWVERVQNQQWAWTPCLIADPANPSTSELSTLGLITYDNNPAVGASIIGQQGTITKVGNLIYYDFYLKFIIDNGTYPAPNYLAIAADRSGTPGGPGVGDPGGLPVVLEEQKAVTQTLPENQLNNGSVTITLAKTSGSSGIATSMWGFIPQGGKVSQTATGIVDLYSLVYNGAAPAIGNGLQTSFTNDWFTAANETETVELAGTIVAQVTQTQPGA